MECTILLLTDQVLLSSKLIGYMQGYRPPIVVGDSPPYEFYANFRLLRKCQYSASSQSRHGFRVGKSLARNDTAGGMP